MQSFRSENALRGCIKSERELPLPNGKHPNPVKTSEIPHLMKGQQNRDARGSRQNRGSRPNPDRNPEFIPAGI
jgi:hypothetical protein